jgi:catechol 2,3-dioxygenase-like lactoylglutathione lyase family enzyme
MRQARSNSDSQAAKARLVQGGIATFYAQAMVFDKQRLFQVAYLVNDVDEACQKWSDLYGAGPFVVTYHHKTDTFMYRGTDAEADVSYGFGYLDDVMIQFITQHDETPSIYRDMYATGEEGYHHVAYLVHDFEAEYNKLIAMGFEPACRLYADKVDAAYFDTRSVSGGFTEIHGDPPHILGAFAGWRRAHELYRPGIDPVITRRKG